MNKRMQGARVSGWLAVLVLTGCTSLEPALANLSTLPAGYGGNRPLKALDASGNGRLDPLDWRALDMVARTAAEAVRAAGGDVGVGAGLYEGPAKDAVPVFGLVRARGETVDLKAVPSDRLRELAIEARWAARQAQMAAMLPLDSLDRTFGGVLVGTVVGYGAGAMEPASVCDAITKFNPGPLEVAGLDATAILDLDSTVWDGNVTDGFLSVLVERSLPKPEANAGLQAFLKTQKGVDPAAIDQASVHDNARLLLERAIGKDTPADLRVSLKDVFYQIVGLLRGMTLAEVDLAARVVFEEGSSRFPAWNRLVFADRDRCGMRRILELLQKQKVEVFLLSATPHPLAKVGARTLGVSEDHVFGSLLEVVDGKYTGQVAANTYTMKASITRQWLPAPPWLAFGDSPASDYAMLLEASGAGLMINPRPQFVEKDEKDAGARLVAVSFDGTEASLAATP